MDGKIQIVINLKHFNPTKRWESIITIITLTALTKPPKTDNHHITNHQH